MAKAFSREICCGLNDTVSLNIMVRNENVFVLITMTTTWLNCTESIENQGLFYGALTDEIINRFIFTCLDIGLLKEIGSLHQ